MRLDIRGFRGETPIVSPRNLPKNSASYSLNTYFDETIVSPLRNPDIVHVFGSDVVTIYYTGTEWLGFDSVVDVAPGPVAGDRIYYTGSGAPKMRVDGTVYDLALPAPVSAATTTNLSATDATQIETILYTYTFVTVFGEESPPAPLSAPLSWSPGVNVEIDDFAAAPSGRGITARRIYRSETSASGVTGLYFVAEIPLIDTTYTHDMVATPLAEAIPSSDYDPPPDTLLGLTAMPNGMMAAFSGKELYFCEPYRPHAWPQKYTLLVDSEIVGLASFGSNLAVLTVGTPYTAQGASPEAMQMVRMESGLPCVSRRGIVDLGYAAIYPSTEGLVLIGGTETPKLTATIFSTDQWGDLAPESIIADRYQGRYVFVFNESAFTTYDGGEVGDFAALPWDEFGGSTVDLDGTPSEYPVFDLGSPQSSFGAQGFGMIDFEGRGGAPDFSRADIATPVAMFRSERTGDVFMLDADQRTVLRWNARNKTNSTFRWRSKVFSSFVPLSYGAIFVRTLRQPTTDDLFTVSILADGRPYGSTTKANTAARLPGNRLALEWQIEIVSSIGVVSVEMAQTLDELLVVMQ